MFKFFQRKIEEHKWRKLVRLHCEPDKDFLNVCRKDFVAKLCQEFPAIKKNRFFRPLIALKYGLAALFGLAFIGGGAVVYADKANVDYNHPLYNFKRMAENVRVTIASSEELPVLHTELAQRRLDEIKKIEVDIAIMTKEVATTTIDIPDVSVIQNIATTTKDLATTTKKMTAQEKIEEKIKEEQKKRQELMANLRNQMRQEVSSVIDQIEQKRVEKKNAEMLCYSLSQIMKGDKETDGDETEKSYMERWSRLEQNCGEFIKIDWRNNQKNNNQQTEGRGR